MAAAAPEPTFVDAELGVFLYNVTVILRQGNDVEMVTQSIHEHFNEFADKNGILDINMLTDLKFAENINIGINDNGASEENLYNFIKSILFVSHMTCLNISLSAHSYGNDNAAKKNKKYYFNPFILHLMYRLWTKYVGDGKSILDYTEVLYYVLGINDVYEPYARQKYGAKYPVITKDTTSLGEAATLSSFQLFKYRYITFIIINDNKIISKPPGDKIYISEVHYDEKNKPVLHMAKSVLFDTIPLFDFQFETQKDVKMCGLFICNTVIDRSIRSREYGKGEGILDEIGENNTVLEKYEAIDGKIDILGGDRIYKMVNKCMARLYSGILFEVLPRLIIHGQNETVKKLKSITQGENSHVLCTDGFTVYEGDNYDIKVDSINDTVNQEGVNVYRNLLSFTGSISVGVGFKVAMTKPRYTRLQQLERELGRGHAYVTQIQNEITHHRDAQNTDVGINFKGLMEGKTYDKTMISYRTYLTTILAD